MMGPSVAAPNRLPRAETQIDETVNVSAERIESNPQPVGARSVQLVLERRFPPGSGEAEAVAVAAPPSGRKALTYAAAVRRSLKIAAGLALVVAFGWAPLRAMFATTSVEAIINARIDTIRSPLEGVVQFGVGDSATWTVAAVPPKLVVANPYADRNRLDELRRQQNALDSQTQTVERESQVTQIVIDALNLQVEKFRESRLKL
ncbi:MAG: hypothetical protein JO347_09115, partial [Candidatus Eremiobacteraeota bacterium]|nr:hypothetical protein [Candidatus Eremiobacteraeota bacterium]